MSEFKASGFSDEFDGGPDLVGITTMTSPYYFVPPSGSTAERPQSPPPGMLRFNEDIGRLEVWRNDHWATILGESPNLGNQLVTNSAGGTGTRGIAAGGRESAPAFSDIIEYITISTLGNAQDFGNLGRGTGRSGAVASKTRGIFIGGQSPSPTYSDNVDYITFASTGGGGSGTPGGSDTQIQFNDGGPRLRTPSGNTLTIHTGGNLGTSDYERLRITSSGDIGIGTDSPATNFKLDVNGDLSLGEFGGTDNTYIDQKQNGSLEIINSGRDSNSGDIRINRTNSISGDTTYFRDFRVYD